MVENIIKKGDVLASDTLKGIIGKYIHARTNVHEVVNPKTKEKEKINVWFAGCVAGYEEANISYDFDNDLFYDETKVTYHVLLTDGTGYVLSEEELVIDEISEEEFIEMVANHKTEEYVKNSILLPGKDF